MKRACKSTDFAHREMKILRMNNFLKSPRVPSDLWKDNYSRMKNIFLPVFLGSCLFTSALYAKKPVADTAKKILPPIQKFYVGTGMDAAIFSTATIQHTPLPPPGSLPATTNTLGTLRFSYFLNLGLTFNYNFNRHIGVYTGVDIKNIGYIETTNGYTNKRRTYTIGVPLGIKIGNMATKRAYVFLGGGTDIPFQYKEKIFQIKSQKTKINEWFSSRTPAVMPYVFAGLAINHGYTFKLQYYPANFMNPDFKDSKGNQPYFGTEVHLILFSAGFAVPVSKRHDLVKKSVTQLNTM
jgi:hypothetical protein